MATNLAHSQIELKDILFTEEEIFTRVSNPEDIFEMCTSEGEELGFTAIEDLKIFLSSADLDNTKYFVRSHGQEEWYHLYEHPYFQRRRPQLVPLNTLNETGETDELVYFLLKHGQKSGPFQKNDILLMLERKNILLTDMISYDSGYSWNKIYQVENFDRRTLKSSEELPGVPNQIISTTQGESSKNSTSQRPETDALTSLAYLSNIKRGRSIEREKVVFYEEEMSKKAGTSGLYKWLLMITLVGISYFLFHIKNQLLSPFKSEESPQIGEQAEMLTPVDIEKESNHFSSPMPLVNQNDHGQVNDQSRSGKFETKQLKPISPMSHRQRKAMEGAKYQQINNNEAVATEDPNYYYDNTSPVELDPVRAQVSKENFDPPPAPETAEPIPSSDNLFESETPN